MGKKSEDGIDALRMALRVEEITEWHNEALEIDMPFVDIPSMNLRKEMQALVDLGFLSTRMIRSKIQVLAQRFPPSVKAFQASSRKKWSVQNKKQKREEKM